MIQLVVGLATIVILGFSLSYFSVMTLLGVRRIRRSRLRLADQEHADSGREHPRRGRSGYAFYFVVPALNEEAVIGRTVRKLAEGTSGRIVVVDDGSADGTGAAVAAAGVDRVTVLRRELPMARQGKGEALNAALEHVVADVFRRELDPQRVIVCVMDADGHLSPGAADHAAALFDDPAVAGVQLAVRIRNADALITRCQDVEFWALSALSQLGRVSSGTVSLGGNGQFTRLAALLELGGKPWGRSLTEDLDLSIRLNTLGWRTVSTPHAYVDQQGVTRHRPLLKQRTRWYQGTMQAAARLPRLWASRQVPNPAALEVSAYVLIPWVAVLPWSVIQHYLLVKMVTGSVSFLPWLTGRSIISTIALCVLWYTLSFFPNLLLGLLYSRRTRRVGFCHALALGHAMILWNYVGYISAYRALWRIATRRRGWDKTARSVEKINVPINYQPATERG